MKLPELASFPFTLSLHAFPLKESAHSPMHALLVTLFLLFQGRFPKCIGANLIVLVSVVTQTQLASLPFE